MGSILSQPDHLVKLAWWQLPGYNIASHIALFHVTLGMMEAILYTQQINAVCVALACTGRHESSVYHDRVSEMMQERCLAHSLLGIAMTPQRDCEAAGSGDQGGKGLLC